MNRSKRARAWLSTWNMPGRWALAGLELALGAGRWFVPPLPWVTVLDRAPDRMPGLCAGSGPLAGGGQGLRLVEAVSRRWGWHRAGFDEKRVWCTFVV